MRAERDPMSGKETEAAISEYEAIIAAGPGAAWLGLDVAYIGLAQLLATGPAEVRDPARAVELARKAVETNDNPNYRFTLATALETTTPTIDSRSLLPSRKRERTRPRLPSTRP